MSLAIKIDVDTDRGTREGVPILQRLLQARRVPASFLFSLGPDNTGKAIRRVFRPGFFAKVRRTNVAGNYGLKTLMYGTVLPAPHIGRRNEGTMRAVRDAGFELGIHCYDHFEWQDYVVGMSLERTREEFQKAIDEFERVFQERPKTAGAPGWQATRHSLQVYDEAGFLYGSDTRGTHAFLPAVGERVFLTPQIPTTLPTLDELLGRDEYPDEKIVPHYIGLIKASNRPQVLTIHAELEGLRYASLFDRLLGAVQEAGIGFFSLEEYARSLRASREQLPVCQMRMGEIDGRSGTLAVQAELVKAVPRR